MFGFLKNKKDNYRGLIAKSILASEWILKGYSVIVLHKLKELSISMDSHNGNLEPSLNLKFNYKDDVHDIATETLRKKLKDLEGSGQKKWSDYDYNQFILSLNEHEIYLIRAMDRYGLVLDAHLRNYHAAGIGFQGYFINIFEKALQFSKFNNPINNFTTTVEAKKTLYETLEICIKRKLYKSEIEYVTRMDKAFRDLYRFVDGTKINYSSDEWDYHIIPKFDERFKSDLGRFPHII